MTTFAEMTEAEIADCIGMWCDCTDGDETRTLVLHGISDNGKDAIFVNPAVVGGGRGPSWTIKSFGYLVTPRPDLPRAWKPDGSPVVGEWAFGALERSPRDGSVTGGGEFLNLEVARTWADDNPHRTVMRRFVGEWEEA